MPAGATARPGLCMYIELYLKPVIFLYLCSLSLFSFFFLSVILRAPLVLKPTRKGACRSIAMVLLLVWLPAAILVFVLFVSSFRHMLFSDRVLLDALRLTSSHKNRNKNKKMEKVFCIYSTDEA